MYNYYCKNCNNKIKYDNKYYDFLNYCIITRSKNFNSICFLDCKNCNKFIGLLCNYVCKHCFGEKQIFGEENLFNFFLKYNKRKEKYSIFNYFCNICNNKNFRIQFWFFKELTFYK